MKQIKEISKYKVFRTEYSASGINPLEPEFCLKF